MYEYPFGAGQQLNLNWIISEIIQLHKQLDPDYVAPTFDNTFPFTNLNVLNLDWILKELKTIKDLAPTEDATLLKMVANALIAATYEPDNSYQENDIVYRDNEHRIYVCINDTTGAWVDADWFEIKIGDVLTALLNVSFNLSASAIANDSGVTGDTVADALNNLVEDVKYETGYLKQKKNGTYSNVIAVEDTPSNNSDRLASSKAAYDLKGAITSEQGQISAYVETGSTASRAYEIGAYIVRGGILYKVIAVIASGGTFTVGTNIKQVTVCSEMQPNVSSNVTLDTDNTSAGTFTIYRIGNLLVIDGFVTLNGSVAGQNAALFTLPVDFRPLTQRSFKAFAKYGTSDPSFLTFIAKTNGEVITATGGNTFSGQIFFPSVIILI